MHHRRRSLKAAFKAVSRVVGSADAAAERATKKVIMEAKEAAAERERVALIASGARPAPTVLRSASAAAPVAPIVETAGAMTAAGGATSMYLRSPYNPGCARARGRQRRCVSWWRWKSRRRRRCGLPRRAPALAAKTVSRLRSRADDGAGGPVLSDAAHGRRPRRG